MSTVAHIFARKSFLAIAFPCLIGLWAASASAQSVIATIPTSSNPGNVAIDAAAGLVYVPINGVGQIDVINEKTNKIVRTLSVGQDAENVALDTATGRLYDADSYTDYIYVIDTKDGRVLDSIPGLEAAWLAVNPATNTIYASNFGNTVYAINGATDTVTAAITVLSAQELAVNPATNKIYVATGDPDEAIVTVIDGNTNTVVTNIDIPGSENTLYVSVDPTRNLVYASDANNTGDPNGAIGVINGATNTVVTSITIPGEPANVAVNSAGHRLYVNNFQLNEVQVANSQNNQLLPTTVPTGTNPTNSAFDSTRGLLYVTNFGSDSITVISTN